MTKTLYINCWHMNDCESAAMWSAYAELNEAIAVKSTYASLRNELPRNTRIPYSVLITPVKYIDYEKDEIPETDNMLTPFIYKRRSFEHERELRAIAMGSKASSAGDSDVRGVPYAVKLEGLIHEIVVSPHAAPWFTEVVRERRQVRACRPGEGIGECRSPALLVTP